MPDARPDPAVASGSGEVAIRRAAAADAPAVAALAAKTFEETFAADNRPEDMAIHLATAYGVEQQTAEIGNPDYVTLLASADGVLAGFAQVRRKDPPPPVTGAAPIELHRFYVDRPWHGRGVAAPLLDACLDAVRGLGGRTVWLSVWERNPRARAFYAKRGFVLVGNADFWVGPDRQTDHILERAVDGESG
ncbi:MAG: GNAT family N-acetyltransferase [Acidobacteria bacterium]|nr:GNAT family N-acetyltransferase [Acidobacteriota bacterium]